RAEAADGELPGAAGEADHHVGRVVLKIGEVRALRVADHLAVDRRYRRRHLLERLLDLLRGDQQFGKDLAGLGGGGRLVGPGDARAGEQHRDGDERTLAAIPPECHARVQQAARSAWICLCSFDINPSKPESSNTLSYCDERSARSETPLAMTLMIFQSSPLFCRK